MAHAFSFLISVDVILTVLAYSSDLETPSEPHLIQCKGTWQHSFDFSGSRWKHDTGVHMSRAVASLASKDIFQMERDYLPATANRGEMRSTGEIPIM